MTFEDFSSGIFVH